MTLLQCGRGGPIIPWLFSLGYLYLSHRSLHACIHLECSANLSSVTFYSSPWLLWYLVCEKNITLLIRWGSDLWSSPQMSRSWICLRFCGSYCVWVWQRSDTVFITQRNSCQSYESHIESQAGVNRYKPGLHPYSTLLTHHWHNPSLLTSPTTGSDKETL